MHQPYYEDLATGEHILPWVRLHAIKDYVDMAHHLETIPGARAVVNFTPVLLEQIEEYAVQVDSFLGDYGTIRDPVLAALAEPAGILRYSNNRHAPNGTKSDFAC